MSRTAIELQDVAFRWPGAGQFQLSVPSLQIAAGERVFLSGMSGSGKSTLLALVCGITRPDKGTVSLMGQDLSAMKSRARDRARAQNIGIIFQSFNLMPYATAVDNVLLPLDFAPDRRKLVVQRGAPLEEAHRLLDALKVGAEDRDRPARNLSVGQQQRVAAARALIGKPGLIVADEPTSSLDKDTERLFMDLLFAQIEEAGSSLLFVSHDTSLAPRFDRSISLSEISGSGNST